MGSVIVVFRIMPSAPENVEQVKREIQKFKPQRVEEEPIAFGLKSLKATFIIPDAGDVLDRLENKLGETENVDNIETLKVTRSL